MTSFDVTRRELGLGAADATTGWYSKLWTETTIEMMIQPKGVATRGLPAGYVPSYDITGWTNYVVKVGDEIVDANGDYYRIDARKMWWIGDQFDHYEVSLKKQLFHADRETTSGTWHLDSDSTKTDPRYRHKLWLDAYLAAANILEDDGATQASTITVFAGADYPLLNVFITKAVDGIFSIDKTPASVEEDYRHYPYKFNEVVPIVCYAIDKDGVTATNLVEQMEQEIRHIATDHPIATIRSIESTSPKYEDIGGTLLWSTTVTIRYTRPNDEYVPTAPTFGYGVGFTYEGDRVAGGIEGTWAETEDGNTGTFPVDAYNNLTLIISATGGNATYYVSNGTNLSLSSTVYTKIRWRYKTSDTNIKAKIVLVFSDAATQEVLADSSSTTWTVGSATITTAKTIDHIRLHADHATGTVYYDFVQIYTGEYILPNVTRMTPPSALKNQVIGIPGMVGNLTQILGADLVDVEMTCDLDVEHTNLTWKRPQTATPKTDYNKTDILMETVHKQAVNGEWVWLDLGDPTMQFKAILSEVGPDFSGWNNRVILRWHEYRHGDASSESTAERFGLAL